MTALGNFTIQVYQEADGSYWASVANLPGCFTMGETLEELDRNLHEAIASYLLSVQQELPQYRFHITDKDVLTHA